MKKFITQLLAFVKSVFSEDAGSGSWKRVVGFILIILFVTIAVANTFFHYDLETNLKGMLDSIIKTLIGAIVLEKVGMALSQKNNS